MAEVAFGRAKTTPLTHSAVPRSLVQLTDTSDTVLLGNVGTWGNYRNWNGSPDSLASSWVAGYYRAGVGFIDSCEERR